MRAVGRVRQRGDALSFFPGKYASGSPVCLSRAPPPHAEWPTSSAAAASWAPARLRADPVSPPDPLGFPAQWQGWLWSAGNPFLFPEGSWFPSLFSEIRGGEGGQWLGWAEHRLFGPPPCSVEGSESPALSHRFEWVLPLSSFAELCGGATSWWDREGPKTVSVTLLGPGVWAWIVCCLEKPLLDCSPFLSNGGVEGRARLRGCHRHGRRRRANLNYIIVLILEYSVRGLRESWDWCTQFCWWCPHSTK